MKLMTINEVYNFLGIPTVFDQYIETGKLPCWNCSASEKLDLEFEKSDFCNGQLIIRIPFFNGRDQ